MTKILIYWEKISSSKLSASMRKHLAQAVINLKRQAKTQTIPYVWFLSSFCSMLQLKTDCLCMFACGNLA